MGTPRGIVEAVYRACNAGDVETMLQDYDENATYWSTNHHVRGRTQIREYFQAISTTFPDMQFEIDNLIESSDWVVVEYTVRATHTGPLPTPSGTIAATGKTIKLSGAEFYQVRNGKIVSDRNYTDSLDLLRQLGLTPAGAARE